MQNRVTKQQAINLKKLGYDLPTNAYYHETSNNVDEVSDYGIWLEYLTIYSAPTISDAIQWMWDRFKINAFTQNQINQNGTVRWLMYYSTPESTHEHNFKAWYNDRDITTREKAQSAVLDNAILYQLDKME